MNGVGGRPDESWCYGSKTPIDHDDWMSPLFGKSLSLPPKRNERLLELFNNAFRCPSNLRRYDYTPALHNPPHSGGASLGLKRL